MALMMIRTINNIEERVPDEMNDNDDVKIRLGFSACHASGAIIYSWFRLR